MASAVSVMLCNTLRVYKGQHFADDEATIGSVAGKLIKHGTKFAPSPQVMGDFEKDLWKHFGYVAR